MHNVMEREMGLRCVCVYLRGDDLYPQNMNVCGSSEPKDVFPAARESVERLLAGRAAAK